MATAWHAVDLHVKSVLDSVGFGDEQPASEGRSSCPASATSMETRAATVGACLLLFNPCLHSWLPLTHARPLLIFGDVIALSSDLEVAAAW